MSTDMHYIYKPIKKMTEAIKIRIYLIVKKDILKQKSNFKTKTLINITVNYEIF